MIFDGFYLIKKDGQYYGRKKEFVDDANDAYAFILPHCAERLATRIGGEVVRK